MASLDQEHETGTAEPEGNADMQAKVDAHSEPDKPSTSLQNAHEVQTSAGNSTEKVSPAELKRKAKEEKAARRAQAKQSAGVQEPAGNATPPNPTEHRASKQKPDQDGAQPVAQGPVPNPQRASNDAAATTSSKPLQPAVPKGFSHLPMAKRVDFLQADKVVHPVILALGQQMATFMLSDGIGRMEGTLLAMKKLLNSYATPPGNSFAVHFNKSMLSPQIDYLILCRPMCIPMGHAISWFKKQVSKIDIDLPDDDAKKMICEDIDVFIRERVTLSSVVIAKSASEMIHSGETVLSFGYHRLVEASLRAAHASGKKISLIVLDDEYDRSGRNLACRMQSLGIDVTYSSGLGLLRWAMQRSSHVLLGAEAMFGNGGMLGRAGSADVAIAAVDAGVRVLALCETVGLSNKISIDSLTYNEIDPEWNSDQGFRLLFDTTNADHISMVVTELGTISPHSVTCIYNNFDIL